MILIGLGGNLDSPEFGPPRETLSAALAALEDRGVGISRRSRWYRSAPLPVADQPWFVNLVVRADTTLPADRLLVQLQAVERDFGRRRSTRNAARILDIDLIDHDGQCLDTPTLTLPHPRMTMRAFVLLPLRDVAPDWRHPLTGLTVDALIAQLPADQQIEADGALPAA